MALIRLNLGCGDKYLPGFVNVDKYGNPDVSHDLETFPWPWLDNQVAEVVAHHVLEHLGATTAIYFGIIKELYRVCADEARIDIRVPHPRHDDFLSDPSHVRPITADGLELFSQTKNRQWQRERRANSPLGLQLGVNFEVLQATHGLETEWLNKLQAGGDAEKEVHQAVRHYNNVVKETHIVLKVIK